MVKIVGILNITPDSFSDGGKYLTAQAAINQAIKMFEDGAEIVDIGAESTRPGATVLSNKQEWERLEPVVTKLLKLYPDKISLDSHKPETLIKVLNKSPVIVNDVTGMNNPKIQDLVIKYQARCIISHLPGNDIQEAHQTMPTKNVDEVKTYLLSKKEMLINRGLPKEKIIIDPGIGFGKTPELNWELLEFAKYVPGHSVLIGYSKKRFLGEKRMELQSNLEAGKIAIKSGAEYIRVHDVAGHRQLLERII